MHDPQKLSLGHDTANDWRLGEQRRAARIGRASRDARFRRVTTYAHRCGIDTAVEINRQLRRIADRVGLDGAALDSTGSATLCAVFPGARVGADDETRRRWVGASVGSEIDANRSVLLAWQDVVCAARRERGADR